MKDCERLKAELASESGPALLLEGMDEAIIGIGRRCGQPSLAIYDQSKILGILERTMSPEDALDYYGFNIAGAWMGEGTPIILESSESMLEIGVEGWDA